MKIEIKLKHKQNMHKFKYYQSSLDQLSGSNLGEVYKQAFMQYKKIKSKTKRRPYVRSRYFKKQKVFLNLFWQHLKTKNPRDRFIRLKCYGCAIDLIRNSSYAPESKDNPNSIHDLLHRFYGMTRDKKKFYVQIKEGKRSGNKYFISVFPERK